MPHNASDEMEEFFDFSALDQNYGLGDFHGSQQIQHEATSSTDNIVAMDWAVDWSLDSATIRPTDVILPYQMQAHDGTNGLYTAQGSQQWPLSDNNITLFMPKIDDSILLTAEPTWPTGNSTPSTDMMYSGLYASNPPSSSSSAPMRSGLAVGNDDVPADGLSAGLESFPPQHDQPAVSISDVPVLETPQSVIQSKPSASLHQALNASWKPASAKRKEPQSRIPLEAKQILEDEFAANPYPCSWEIDIIAHQANLDVKKVRNWFNNTRARKKGGGECFQARSLLLYSRMQTHKPPQQRCRIRTLVC
jgi:hypothetical protein